MCKLRLQRVVDRVRAGVARIDAPPVGEWTIGERPLREWRGGRHRLIEVGRPWQLYGPQRDVRYPQTSVPAEVPLDAEVPLNRVWVFEVRIVGRAEIGLSIWRRGNAAAVRRDLRQLEERHAVLNIVRELPDVRTADAGQRIEHSSEDRHRVPANAAANDRLRVVKRTVREAESRIEVLFLRESQRVGPARLIGLQERRARDSVERRTRTRVDRLQETRGGDVQRLLGA